MSPDGLSGSVWSVSDLPTPQPRVVITADDLRAALTGIPDGWYRTSDLLPRYLAWAEGNGKPVVDTKTLGEAIARTLRPRRKTGHGTVATWWIDARALRGEGRVDIWESPLKGVDVSSLPRYPGT